MLNRERVILMTKMASYEAGEGKRNMAIAKYFRSDYVAIQLFKAIISATLSYFLILGLYIYYNFEVFMENIYELDVATIVGSFVRNYVILLVVYLLISYGVCSIKYIMARKKLKRYYSNLKKLKKLYEE